MTDSIPLDELPGSEERRDRWGRYMIVPPDGGKPIGYTRVTTVAKALESGGGLAPWKATMTASGIIMRRGLRAQWEALLAQHGDPWYASPDAKAEAKRLVEECAAVGGANDRKEIGSSLHAITALIDLGKTPQHLSEETERDTKAYVAGLVAAGVTIVPGQVELTTVLDRYQVAGTFDRLATVPGFDLPLIADLKTGANLEYSWQSIAVQLAAYSRGDAIYVQGQAKDGSQDRRLPMPKVDQHWGLIFWLNAGVGDLELYLVDLAAGWEAFEHSLWARNWRQSQPAEAFKPGDMTGQLQASLDHLEQPSADVGQLREWLQRRIDTIGHDSPLARDALRAEWPSDVPTLRRSDTHTAQELDVIEQLLDDIERRYSISFPPAKPGQREHDEAVARVVDLFPGTTINPKDSA